MTNKNLSHCNHLQCALGVALLALLTACPASPPAASTATAATPAPQVAGQPVVVVQAEVMDTAGFIYYPDYEVYFDPGARVYWYNEGGRWSSAASPVGVSVDVLLASSSTHMNFHDSPENHHAQVVQQFPHGWKPASQPDSDRDRRGH